MSSDNPIGADNQQGRLESYLSGFADGEGSFFTRNPLLSDKRYSFDIFASIVHAMDA